MTKAPESSPGPSCLYSLISLRFLPGQRLDENLDPSVPRQAAISLADSDAVHGANHLGGRIIRPGDQIAQYLRRLPNPPDVVAVQLVGNLDGYVDGIRGAIGALQRPDDQVGFIEPVDLGLSRPGISARCKELLCRPMRRDLPATTSAPCRWSLEAARASIRLPALIWTALPLNTAPALLPARGHLHSQVVDTPSAERRCRADGSRRIHPISSATRQCDLSARRCPERASSVALSATMQRRLRR